MTKIERRHAIVTLYSGDYHARLAALMEDAMSALRDEELGVTPRRAATKSVANAKAMEYDELVREADAEGATKVLVWALRYDHMTDLQDENPPREDESRDAVYGVNMKTFPRVLTEVAVLDPAVADAAEDLEDLKAKGRAAMLELGVSAVQYKKLETGAWNVNVLGDEIPKGSIASLLREAREAASKPPPDSESAPKSSTGTSRQRRTSTSTRKVATPAGPSSPATPDGTTQPAPAP